MNQDYELGPWCSDWQSTNGSLSQKDQKILADLPHHVERESVRMRIMLVVKIVLTISFIGTTTALSIRNPSTHMISLLTAVILFFCIGWAVSLDTWRGAWGSSCQDSAEFLNLSIRRCRASLRAMNTAMFFTLCELLFIGIWSAPQVSSRTLGNSIQFVLSPTTVVIALTALVMFVYLVRRKARKRDELRLLLLLHQDDMRADSSASDQLTSSMRT